MSQFFVLFFCFSLCLLQPTLSFATHPEDCDKVIAESQRSKKKPSKIAQLSKLTVALLGLSVAEFGRELLMDNTPEKTGHVFRKISEQYWRGLPRLHNGSLSARWAQERVGADLAAQMMRTLKSQGKLLHPATYGIIDSSFDPKKLAKDRLHPDFESQTSLPVSQSEEYLKQSFRAGDHAEHVINLVSDPELSASPYAQLRYAIEGVRLNNFLKEYPGDSSMKFDPKPLLDSDLAYVNASYVASVFNQESLDQLSKDPQAPPLIMAAGNWKVGGFLFNFLEKHIVPSTENYHTDIPGVVVGSLRPDGDTSYFSVGGKKATVMAPSDLSILSGHSSIPVGQEVSGGGNSSVVDLELFGGTSGAAPLVTSGLLNVVQLNGRLNLKETTEILKRTSIPTPNGRLLNDVKLVKVAERLQEDNFAEQTPEQRIAMISDPNNYLFASEAARVDLQAEQISGQPTYDELVYLDRLRLAFQLMPTKIRAKKIEQFYESQGLTTDAQFYKHISQTLN